MWRVTKDFFLDVAGDMIGVFEWNPASYANQWFVPTTDLVEIYKVSSPKYEQSFHNEKIKNYKKASVANTFLSIEKWSRTPFEKEFFFICFHVQTFSRVVQNFIIRKDKHRIL